MLEVKNVSLKVGQRPILRDVSLQVPRGSLTALLGKNGCGKSTLVGCIAGQRRFSGTVTLNGQDLAALSPRERALRMALLPQVLPLPRLTAQEVTALGRTPRTGLSGRLAPEDREAVERAMALTDTLAFRHTPVDRLSGGERQRVFLAMTLAQDAPLLVLDEPAAHLDAAARRSFACLLARLARETDKTVLAVMHDVDAAAAVCDRIAVMEEGRITFCGTREACLKAGAIERAFGLKRYEASGQLFFAP